MAQVVMTDAQKELLLADPNFAIQVKWSILDQANFTRGLDGSGTFTAVSFKQLAQWKPLAAQLIGNQDIINGAATKFFVNQIAINNIPCWDNVENTTTAAINYLIANNYFGANALAQAWFTQQTYQGPW